MPKKIMNLPKVADPTIETVLKLFIKETAAAKGSKKADKKGATELFMNFLNGYAHRSLSSDEGILFDHYYNLEGKGHKEFCQVFGPDKILENIGEFVGYFLIRRVMMPGDQMAESARVVAELCKWLLAKNMVPAEDVRNAIEKAERAAQQLPRAEDANRIIWQLAQKCPQDTQEYVDFGYMTVTRIENDSIWLRRG